MQGSAPQTVRDLRRGNRSVVLSSLYLDGPSSRQQLIRSTGLSSATVSTVTGELIDAGTVVPKGQVESTGGRPQTILEVNPARYVVGLTVGPARLVAGVVDLAMRARATVVVPLSPGGRDAGEVASRIVRAVDTALAQAGLGADQVLGVGVSVSGIVEHTTELQVSDQTMGWSAVPLERLLRAHTTLPLFIDNGAKNLGRAEMWFGAGRGARDAVIALVSSGVGAAIVVDGAVLEGASRSAGEWGHMTVEVGGRPCRCGARGCLEAYVGAGAVVERYRELAGGRPPVPDDETALRQVVTAAASDAAAAQVLDETATYLGVGVANLVNLVNPERIVIGGWAGTMLGERLLPAVREAVRRNALDEPFGHTSIELSRLGDDAGVVGAATLPVAAFLRSGGTSPPAPSATR